MTDDGEGLHGLIAEFDQPEHVLAAARAAHSQGYRRMDAYAPYPVEGLAEALGKHKTPVAAVAFIAGIAGAAGGYFLQYYATAVDYPLNVGGRPHHSWPSFIPITFELTVLCAGVAAFFSVFWLNRLPEPYHPVFNVTAFQRASVDRFFLCIEASDPQFDVQNTAEFLHSLKPCSVSEVAS